MEFGCHPIVRQQQQQQGDRPCLKKGGSRVDTHTIECECESAAHLWQKTTKDKFANTYAPDTRPARKHLDVCTSMRGPFFGPFFGFITQNRVSTVTRRI